MDNFTEVRGNPIKVAGWGLPFIPVTIVRDGRTVMAMNGVPLIIRREFLILPE